MNNAEERLEHLRLEASDHISVVTLDRPSKLNSLNLTLQKELHDVLHRLSEDESCRAIVLTGSGRAFSSGQDLSERRAALDGAVPDLGASLDRYYHPIIRLIRSSSKPVIAAVNGVAAGAGANLALACDIVIASRSATLLEAFARIGLIPDCGGTWMLPRLVGDARARGMALLGEEISAEIAVDWGLIWKVVDDDQLMSEARATATKLTNASAGSIRLMKQAFAVSWEQGLSKQMDTERDFQRQAGAHPDYREGVKAFFEKRSPQFNSQID